MDTLSSSSSIETNTSVPIKKPRGRPSKYSPEERKEKYKQLTKQWQDTHKDDYQKYQKDYHQEHEISKQRLEFQLRAKNALQLLTEMIEADELQFKTPKYKELTEDLIKHKKIIYSRS